MAIIKTIPTEEANRYKCCNMDKMCVGNDCMAWVEGEVKVDEKPREGYLKSPVGIYTKSGKGYCGLVKK